MLSNIHTRFMNSHNPAASIMLTGWALQAVCPAPCTTSRLFGYKNSQAGIRNAKAMDTEYQESPLYKPSVCACLKDWTEGAFGY